MQVPEGRQLFGKMTVEENLLMGAQRQKDRFRDAVRFRARL
jgi:ABC-type branched-subunit amino acid transport system ATPase component